MNGLDGLGYDVCEKLHCSCQSLVTPFVERASEGLAQGRREIGQLVMFQFWWSKDDRGRRWFIASKVDGHLELSRELDKLNDWFPVVRRDLYQVDLVI